MTVQSLVSSRSLLVPLRGSKRERADPNAPVWAREDRVCEARHDPPLPCDIFEFPIQGVKLTARRNVQFLPLFPGFPGDQDSLAHTPRHEEHNRGLSPDALVQ